MVRITYGYARGLAENLVSEIIGGEVREHCDREGSPRCRFEVLGNEN